MTPAHSICLLAVRVESTQTIRMHAGSGINLGSCWICKLTRDLFALFVQQQANISTDTERRAGLSAITELLVYLTREIICSPVLELPGITGDGGFPRYGCGPPCNTRRRSLGAFGTSVSYFSLGSTTGAVVSTCRPTPGESRPIPIAKVKAVITQGLGSGFCPWYFDLRVSACRGSNTYYTATDFGADSSSRFASRARTDRQDRRLWTPYRPKQPAWGNKIQRIIKSLLYSVLQKYNQIKEKLL